MSSDETDEEFESDDSPPQLPITEEARAESTVGGEILINGLKYWPSQKFGDKPLTGQFGIHETGDIEYMTRVQSIALNGWLNLAEQVRIVVNETNTKGKAK